MINKIKSDNRGFSLIELLVCLAISSMVIIAAYSLVLVGTKSYENNSKSTTIQKESSFTTGLLADSVRDANIDKTIIKKYDSGILVGDIEIHTGKDVIYYDKSKNSIYIYDEVKGLGDGSYRINAKDNLITRYVTSFDANFVSGNKDIAEPNETDYKSDNGVSASETDSVTNELKVKYSMIKFTMAFEYKGKTDSTEVIYQIRNVN